MKARKIITGVLAAAVMATIVAFPAQAQMLSLDRKLYPGSMCVRLAGSTNVLPTLNFSRLFNPATSNLLLDCPVVHDSINQGIEGGHVDVIDQNFAGDAPNDGNVQVCAELVSVSQAFSSSLTIRSLGRRCTRGAGLTSQRLNNFVDMSGDRNAHYFYSVSIPPTFNRAQSGIISYSVQEFHPDENN